LTAVSFRDEDPDKTKLAGLLPEVFWKLFVAIALLSNIWEFFFSKLPGSLDDILLFLSQIEVH
jgi:hypothetical protein